MSRNEDFGESKVVAHDGTPLVVYHGTGSVIEEFDNRVTFFTSDFEMAKGYARRGGKGVQNVIAVHLNIQNPKVFDFLAPNTPGWYAKRRGSLLQQGYDGMIIGGNVFVAFWSDQIRRVQDIDEHTSRQSMRA
jgi:hypothetical protein